MKWVFLIVAVVLWPLIMLDLYAAPTLLRLHGAEALITIVGRFAIWSVVACLATRAWWRRRGGTAKSVDDPEDRSRLPLPTASTQAGIGIAAIIIAVIVGLFAVLAGWSSGNSECRSGPSEEYAAASRGFTAAIRDWSVLAEPAFTNPNFTYTEEWRQAVLEVTGRIDDAADSLMRAEAPTPGEPTGEYVLKVNGLALAHQAVTRQFLVVVDAETDEAFDEANDELARLTAEADSKRQVLLDATRVLGERCGLSEEELSRLGAG